MRIVNTGTESLQLPDYGLIAEPGKPVDVPAEVASELLARPGWKKAKSEKTTRPPEGSES
jgi:hypothetical protein